MAIKERLLRLLDTSLSQDSLIGSTISTKSRRKKNTSCASKISSPSVLSHGTKSSKVSRESDVVNFYPKSLNHAFMPKPNFEECCNEIKQIYEESQNYLVEDGIEEADNSSSFMKISRARTNVALDEKRHVLPSWVIWDGNLDRFEEIRNKGKDIVDKLVQVTYLIWIFKRPI